nr:reverse transcriptase domain-containing protein [Tanacetum cinerariifolium]
MSRRLRRYFEAHPIKVITDQPLKQILNKSQASRKLAKYSVELGAYNITYDPKNALKGQVLADFLSEAPVGIPTEEFFRLPTKFPNKDDVERWILFIDGGVEHTNNEAEYEALLVGLRMARKMKVQNIDVKVDSKLELKLKGQNFEKLATHVFDHLTKKVLVEENGLVERANKSLMEGIKARLGTEWAEWVDELPNVLWAHHTSLKQSNDETPFSLTYGSEAVIPAEIGMPTHRTMMIKEDKNEEELRPNMDLLQERREAVTIREANYKNKME